MTNLPFKPDPALFKGFPTDSIGLTSAQKRAKYRAINAQTAQSTSNDRLRNGTMSDSEAIKVSADTVRSSIEPNWPDSVKEMLFDLASRLELVLLANPHQTRAYSTVKAIQK